MTGVAWQHCCCATCQISKRLENSKYQSHTYCHSLKINNTLQYCCFIVCIYRLYSACDMISRYPVKSHPWRHKATYDVTAALWCHMVRGRLCFKTRIRRSTLHRLISAVISRWLTSDPAELLAIIPGRFCQIYCQNPAHVCVSYVWLLKDTKCFLKTLTIISPPQKANGGIDSAWRLLAIV